MLNNKFQLKSKYQPAGDQPQAIAELVAGLKKGHQRQTLLGVTGSGKTFTVANVINQIQKPTLVIAHNKTLAAQLAQEYKQFFPNNAVHYFVSYYDYYQPEAYMPITDTYIEKDAMINEEIDRLRHASTQALLTRQDVIIVASVSCIYGLGSPKEYEAENVRLSVGTKISRADLVKKLVAVHFERTTADLTTGAFRALANVVEVMPTGEREVYRIIIENDLIERIEKIDPVARTILATPTDIFVFPAKHFLTNDSKKKQAIKNIKAELITQLKKFAREGNLLAADRLKRRTNYDLAMIKEVGYCSGIENYSRHLSGKAVGEPPETLLSYFPSITVGTGPHKRRVPDFLTVIDESHVTLSQIGGMYAGDQSRKNTLVDHGFRLPSAKDNRPLKYDEFVERIGQVIYTTATPGNQEKETSQQIVEQIIRPTGLIDPEVEVRPVSEGQMVKKFDFEIPRSRTSGAPAAHPGQIKDFIAEAEKDIAKGGRVIATTLTKKMAEDLATFLKDPPKIGRAGKGIKAEYLHSEIKTLDRIKILTEFRRGNFDCLVGVNLLREGLDLPEVTFIGILDADKEGFLRSETSLIQIIGRAARNVAGRVILYADNITGSMERAISETNRRRTIQVAYNKAHGITPQTIIKKIHDITEELESERSKTVKNLLAMDQKLFGKDGKNLKKLIKQKDKQMSQAVKDLDFETAAIIRDEIKELNKVAEK